MKVGEKLSCVQCKGKTFELILEHISQEDFEGEMFAIACAKCGYIGAYLDGDAVAALEIEKVYLESELEKIN